MVGDYKEVADEPVDVIINATGSDDVGKKIGKAKSKDTELLGRSGASLVLRLAEDRRRRLAEKERVSRVNESFYHLGLIIENISAMGEAGYVIVEYANKLTNTPAAVLALMDDKSEEMLVMSAKGFSAEFEKIKRWNIGQCELTKKMLGSDGPFYVKDLTEYPNAMPFFISEGVRSLLVVPLTLEGRNIGAIIVADFEEHVFQGEDLSTLSLFSVYAAITVDRVRNIEQMRRQSQTDGLTSLYNQRYLMEQLNKELQRASRHGHKVSVIMLDVDYFKRYNDTFGHLEGNKVLKEVSRILSRNSRFADTVGRFGGEEFCLILPEIEKEGAHGLCREGLKGRRPLPDAEKECYPECRGRHLSGGR